MEDHGSHEKADGTGQRLWSRAKELIPGGGMLLSKRPEMFLPDGWPTYFSRASGCRVWDLDDREYVDMSLMGVGTSVLGYGHPEVDEAVRRAVRAGNVSTLNCPEEVSLAERLVALHPWADMVRFARTGGEANAIAVRIARAASGRDRIAFCGYHGWHDWYLAANLRGEDDLAEHLLAGLEPAGVPSALRGSVIPFSYGRIENLEEVLSRYDDIGVIKMEVSRSSSPPEGYLQAVRRLATERGLILIFDECSSGFRETFGGLHLKYGVEPDMAVFGKALGNGYAISAVIGRLEIMEAAQETFISSTFWTERIGPSAALKTLEVMERVRSWETLPEIGSEIRRRWEELSRRHGLSLTNWGMAAVPGFTVDGAEPLAYKTLITQEMLKAGFLASNLLYVSTAHRAGDIDRYFDALEPVFASLRECEEGRDVTTLLEGPVCHSGFQRLN